MIFKVFLSILTTLLFISTRAFAGGGLVSFDSSPSLVRPGEQYTVRPQVYSDQYGGTPCKQCPITIKFENSQSGDAISQSDSKTDNNGTMSAKVLSQQAGERTIYADVTMPDGTSYQSSGYVLNYDPKVGVSGNISVKVDSQRVLANNVRQVNLSWNVIPDTKYLVFARPINASYGWALLETNNLNAAITINTTPNYYVKVDACNGYGTCIESQEVLISEIIQEIVSPTTKPTVSVKPKVVIIPTIRPTPTPLKITVSTSSSNLMMENKQNFWQGRINSIISWFKSVFPILR